MQQWADLVNGSDGTAAGRNEGQDWASQGVVRETR
jgi:hypothetical protein